MKKKMQEKLVEWLNPHYKMKGDLEREALKIEEERKAEIQDWITNIELLSNSYYKNKISDCIRENAYRFYSSKILECLPNADVFVLSVDINATRENLPRDRDLEIVTFSELKESLDQE